VRFARSLGLRAGDKDTLDEYKSRMADGLVERPEDYLRYAVGDVTLLLELHVAFVKYFRTIQQECLGMEGDDLWTPDDIPMTGGALVARTLERWIYSQAADRDVLKFSLRKMGTLDPGDRRHKFSLWAYLASIEKIRTPTALRAALDAGEGAFRKRRFLGAGFRCSQLLDDNRRFPAPSRPGERPWPSTDPGGGPNPRKPLSHRAIGSRRSAPRSETSNSRSRRDGATHP
jgi:hypothetical protein